MNRTTGLGLLLALSLTACGGGGGKTDAAPPIDAAPADANFQDPVLPDLAPPMGFSFRSPAFDVAAGTEEQDCYFIAVPDVNGDGSPVYVDRITAAVNPGSHHMNVFRVKTIVNLMGMPGDVVKNGECFKSANWADWPLVTNTQNSSAADPITDWQLPANVAHFFQPGELLMVQTHYVNASSQDTPTHGKVSINFYKFAGAGTPMELGTLFATDQNIRVCQHDAVPTEFSKSCSFSAGATIIAANGHFHSRGQKFRIWSWDGMLPQQPTTAPFYTSNDWSDPPMTQGLNIVVPPGGGVWYTCDFQWMPPVPPAATCAILDAKDQMRFPMDTPDCCYTFGPHVEENEHCNAFVYYYPKGTTNITCQ